MITPHPVTGDGWTFGFSDGSVRAVCKNASLPLCDGAAHVRSSTAAGVASVDMLLEPPDAAVASLQFVVYGGMGPWLTESDGPKPNAEQCVYPHSPRFGLEACALYNGEGGYDAHAGVAMPAQWWSA